MAATPESPDSPRWDDMVLVGRIARPHGLRGHVIVSPETDFVEERFAEGETVWTRSPGGEEALVIASARVQNGRPVIAFEGLDRIEDVERLAGQELRVPEAVLQPLEPGTFYQHELVGCVVETTGGETVGEVARVEGGAAGSLLAIEAAHGEVLIPLAVDICVDIDVPGKRIRIDPPEGLLDLNERPAVARSERRRQARTRSARPRTGG
jgi:16S rRNA processing protein RimM